MRQSGLPTALISWQNLWALTRTVAVAARPVLGRPTRPRDARRSRRVSESLATGDRLRATQVVGGDGLRGGPTQAVRTPFSRRDA